MEKLLFIHIPRTGGSTIVSHAAQLDVCIKGHNIREKGFQHLRELDKNLLSDYHLFTIIRNPWERVLSAFLYLNNGGINLEDAMDGKKYVEKYQGDFNEFIFYEFNKKSILNQLHFIPQLMWIEGPGYEIKVDTILKFRSFTTNLKDFFALHDRNFQALPKINSTQHTFYTKYYSLDSREIVRNVYRKEIYLFDFKFGD